MTEQLSLTEGQRLRDEAIEKHEANNGQWLERMRRHARQYSTTHGSVTTDDLHAFADAHNDHPTEPRAYGGVFLPRRHWKKTGEYIQSRRKQCHARPIPVWRFVGGGE